MHSLSALKWCFNLDNMPALSKRKKLCDGRENDVKCSLLINMQLGSFRLSRANPLRSNRSVLNVSNGHYSHSKLTDWTSE